MVKVPPKIGSIPGGTEDKLPSYASKRMVFGLKFFHVVQKEVLVFNSRLAHEAKTSTAAKIKVFDTIDLIFIILKDLSRLYFSACKITKKKMIYTNFLPKKTL